MVSALDKLSKLLVSMVFIAITMCSSIASAEVFTDALNRRVNITRVDRVVSLSPAITELLAYFNQLDKVIGADELSLTICWYLNASSYLRAKGVESIGGYWGPTISIDKILELNPDLVLADIGAHIGLRETFESYNINVVYIYGGEAKSIDAVYADIRLIGAIFNKTREAEELISRIDYEIRLYGSEITRIRPGLSVLVIIHIDGGIWVAGKDTYIDNLLSKLGVKNSVPLSGWSVANIEQVYQWNPDMIIIASHIPVTEAVLESSGLSRLNKTIVVLNSTEVDILSRPGPLLLYAPRLLYEKITTATTPSLAEETVTALSLETVFIVLLVIVIIGIALVIYVKRRR